MLGWNTGMAGNWFTGSNGKSQRLKELQFRATKDRLVREQREIDRLITAWQEGGNHG